jgi:hypothetical protein
MAQTFQGRPSTGGGKMSETQFNDPMGESFAHVTSDSLNRKLIADLQAEIERLIALVHSTEEEMGEQIRSLNAQLKSKDERIQRKDAEVGFLKSEIERMIKQRYEESL